MWRRRLITVAVAAAAGAGTITFATSAWAQNYCIPHPAADGCNLPRLGPHISAASISGGRLQLTLTFHKAGRFVAHLKRNPPREPYDRDWGSRPTLGRPIQIGSHPAGRGTVTVALGSLAPGRYGVIVIPAHLDRAQPGRPIDPATAPSWVYFTERGGRAVDIRVLQP